MENMKIESTTTKVTTSQIKEIVQKDLEENGIPICKRYDKYQNVIQPLTPQLNGNIKTNEGLVDIKVNDNGNVQVFLRGTSGQTASITYNFYDEDHSVGSTFINGTADPNVPSQAPALMTSAAYDTDNDYYSVIYQSSAAGGGGLDGYITKAKSTLGLTNEGRSVYGGASAGAEAVIALAKNDPTGKFDMILCDAATDGDRVPFVDTMLKDTKLIGIMKENNNIVFAYEANGGLTGTPEKAVKEFIKLSKEGVEVIVGVNPTLTDHSITVSQWNTGIRQISPEDMVVNGTLSNIIHEWDPKQLSSGVVNDKETLYYYLKTPEFLNGHYLKDGKLNSELAHTTEEVAQYVRSLRGIVAETFMDMGQTDEITAISENSFNSKLSTLGLTYQVYSGVVGNANSIITSANNTTCANKGISDNAFFNGSTAVFPNSLNTANSFLYGKTADLLGYVKQDMSSLQSVLEGKVTLENYLLSETFKLTSGSADSTNPDIGLDNTVTSLIDPAIMSVFEDNIKTGKVGMISVGDLSNALSSDGIIMQGLSNEIADAQDLSNMINNFVGSLEYNGEDWKAIKDHFEGYEELCSKRIEAANILKVAYEDAINLVKNYIYPDENMDDGRIPEFKEKILNLIHDINRAKDQIKCLQAENVTLSHTQPDCHTITDVNGRDHTYCDWSPVYAARAQIAANNETIASLNEQIEIAEAAKKEAEIYLARLEGLNTVINEANNILSQGINEANSLYGTALNDFSPVVM